MPSLLDMAYANGFGLSLANLGHDATVTLRKTKAGAGFGFPLRILLGRRGARNRTEGLTQGIDQGAQTLRFRCEDWALGAPAGRDPEIGDVVTLSDGRRLAFSESPVIRYCNELALAWLVDCDG